MVDRIVVASSSYGTQAGMCLLLDPVYTGRAMAGLLDLVRRGEFGREETVLFWHTGGSAALFAYADGLLAEPGAARPR
ncbi:MAG: hypothetical protein ACJ79E_04650 [Anaeromyxobacteraceae bacterium]